MRRLYTAEDNDWAYRALRAGIPILYAPEIVVYHVHWRDKTQMAAVYRTYAWSQGAFYGKHLRQGDWSMLLRTAISLFRGVRSLINGVLNNDYDRRANGYARLTLLLPGLIAGLRGLGSSQMSLSERKVSSGRDHKSANELHIVWIYSGSLATALDAATWLKTVKELRHFGWRVTLVAAGPDGYHQIRGVEVLCIPRPEIYLLRQVAFHLRVLQFVVRQWATIDMILFHEISAPWILPLRLVRRLTGKRRPVLVMDTRSLPMPPSDKQTWKDKVRKGAYIIEESTGQSLCRWSPRHHPAHG